jgi:hypothetical protein
MSSASVLPSTGEEAASGNPGGLLTEKDASLKDDVIKSQGETTAVANKISAKPGVLFAASFISSCTAVVYPWLQWNATTFVCPIRS